MANNYVQFSAALEINSEQKVWAEKYLPLLSISEDDVESLWSDFLKEGIDLKIINELNKLLFDFEMQCEVEIDSDGLWFYSEESGSVDVAVTFAHCIMSKFQIPGEFMITWAETSDKMRLNEFSGGTALVTKDAVAWCASDRQLEYCREQISYGDNFEDSNE